MAVAPLFCFAPVAGFEPTCIFQRVVNSHLRRQFLITGMKKAWFLHFTTLNLTTTVHVALWWGLRLVKTAFRTLAVFSNYRAYMSSCCVLLTLDLFCPIHFFSEAARAGSWI